MEKLSEGQLKAVKKARAILAKKDTWDKDEWIDLPDGYTLGLYTNDYGCDAYVLPPGHGTIKAGEPVQLVKRGRIVLHTGETIQIKGQIRNWRVTEGPATVLTATDWGKKDQPDWNIEMMGYGGYHYWKQQQEGGTLTFDVPEDQ